MPPKRRPGNQSAKIAATIRRLHLNSPPTWYSIKANNTDPPTVSEDSAYQRKVRIVATTTAAPADFFKVTALELMTAAGLTPTIFNKLFVNQAKFYGQANGSGIRVSTFLPTVPEGTSDFQRSKSFNDYGIQGARRPCIHVKINPKDIVPILANNGNAIFTVSCVDQATGAVAPGSIIIDVWVTFFQSRSVLLRTALDVLHEEAVRHWDGVADDQPHDQKPPRMPV